VELVILQPLLHEYWDYRHMPLLLDPFSQFCCEVKATLKTNYIFTKERTREITLLEKLISIK
jgi:hypothetical protein